MATKPQETWTPLQICEIHQPSLIVRRTFNFRTFPEARALSQHIAQFCPNPSMAAMGLGEIFINAIEHGNLGIDFKTKASFENEHAWLDEINRRLLLKENIHKFVRVHLEITPLMVKVMIYDQGPGFFWESFGQFKADQLELKNGRGILIAKSCGVDELIYHAPGNQVECIFYIRNESKPISQRAMWQLDDTLHATWSACFGID